VSTLIWLIIPVGATIGAIVYFGWTGRKRPPIDSNSVAAHEKFRAAMKRQNQRKQ